MTGYRSSSGVIPSGYRRPSRTSSYPVGGPNGCTALTHGCRPLLPDRLDRRWRPLPVRDRGRRPVAAEVERELAPRGRQPVRPLPFLRGLGLHVERERTVVVGRQRLVLGAE